MSATAVADGSSRLRVHAVPAGLLLAASAVIYGPTLLHPFSQLPFYMGDGALTVWNYWWAKRALIDLGTNPFASSLLFCYWLSALAAYACAWSETRDRVASLAAGVGYGFCAFHVSWFAMPSVSAMDWVPLYVLALRRALVEPGIRWTAASGLCVLLCTFQSSYFTVLLGLVTVFVVGIHLGHSHFERRDRLDAFGRRGRARDPVGQAGLVAFRSGRGEME